MSNMDYQRGYDVANSISFGMALNRAAGEVVLTDD